jgi:hypothetical protein
MCTVCMGGCVNEKRSEQSTTEGSVFFASRIGRHDSEVKIEGAS